MLRKFIPLVILLICVIIGALLFFIFKTSDNKFFNKPQPPESSTQAFVINNSPAPFGYFVPFTNIEGGIVQVWLENVEKEKDTVVLDVYFHHPFNKNETPVKFLVAPPGISDPSIALERRSQPILYGVGYKQKRDNITGNDIFPTLQKYVHQPIIMNILGYKLNPKFAYPKAIKDLYDCNNAIIDSLTKKNANTPVCTGLAIQFIVYDNSL